MFTIFRVFNISWILFCAIMVELTLNQNHMISTLAQSGGIGNPAQLLPLLVGILSFFRVLFLIYIDQNKKRTFTTLDQTTSKRQSPSATIFGIKFRGIFAPTAALSRANTAEIAT